MCSSVSTANIVMCFFFIAGSRPTSKQFVPTLHRMFSTHTVNMGSLWAFVAYDAFLYQIPGDGRQCSFAINSSEHCKICKFLAILAESQQTLTHYHTMPHFDALKIVTSNFSFSHYVFYPIQYFFSF